MTSKALHVSTVSGPKGNLVVSLEVDLRRQIESGEFEIGERLPSEARLTELHGVSRTVVREAIAALRSDGLVEPRQGSGVYVIDTKAAPELPFSIVDPDRVSSVIEMLELRTAVEVEAAGIAAIRKSPAQEERMLEAFRKVAALGRDGRSTSVADFELHLAIAEGTNNPRFGEFLRMLGENTIPRNALRADAQQKTDASYQARLDAEHAELIDAIIAGDARAARDAMRAHLEGSQRRYRTLLREQAS